MSESAGLEVEALAVSGLLDYQDDAIVSRTLLKKPAGTVTVFAFDAGQELSEHTVQHDALLQVVEGEAGISISGTMHRVGKGQMIRLPGGEPHAVKALEKFKMMLTMIR